MTNYFPNEACHAWSSSRSRYVRSSGTSWSSGISRLIDRVRHLARDEQVNLAAMIVVVALAQRDQDLFIVADAAPRDLASVLSVK